MFGDNHGVVEGWWKGEIKKQTMYSGKSTTSQLLTVALLSHTTSPAKKIQQMNPLTESMPPYLPYYLPYPFQKEFNNSLSTMIANLFPENMISQLEVPSQNHSQNQSEITCALTPKQITPTAQTSSGSKLKSPSNRPRFHSPCTTSHTDSLHIKAFNIQPRPNSNPIPSLPSLPCPRSPTLMETPHPHKPKLSH